MTPDLLVPPVYFHRPSFIGSTDYPHERSLFWAARFDGSKWRKICFIDR